MNVTTIYFAFLNLTPKAKKEVLPKIKVIFDNRIKRAENIKNRLLDYVPFVLVLFLWKNVKKLLTNTIKAVIIFNVAFYVNRKMGGR